MPEPEADATAAAKASAGGSSSSSSSSRPPSAAAGQQLHASTSLRKRSNSFLIGVAGGTASGKTTVCSQIMHRLHDQCVALIHQDSFYRGLTPAELKDVKSYNFDHPDAFDHEALMQCLSDLKAGRSVEVPIYDFSKHARSSEVRKVDPADVIIVEGILVLHVPELRELLSMKVYVDTDNDIRLARRIQRDVASRGRDINNVIEQYTKFVKPSFDSFVAPSRRYADVIIPWQRGDNIVAIDLVTEHIKTKLQQHSLVRIYPNIHLMPSSHQIRGMHTIIRDVNTKKSDFTFFADRLNRLVVEAGLGLLPFSEQTITTPTAHRYVGVSFARKLCGVSIIRSGESMEAALRTCCKGIKIGKILVVRHGLMSRTGARALSPRSATTSAANGGLLGSPRSSGPQQQQQQQHASSSSVSPAPEAAAGSSGQQQQQPGQPAPAAASSGSSNGSSSTANGPSHQQQTQQSSSQAFHSSEGSAFAAAATAAGISSPRGLGGQASQDVIYEKLPADIAARHVLLMDPVLSTGSSAARAIEVLLARGCAADRIILLCIIAAPEGIARICSRWPGVRLVCSDIDDHVDSEFNVVPGCGEFGDRYFCD